MDLIRYMTNFLEDEKIQKKGLLRILLTVSLFIGISVVAISLDLDRRVVSFFYSADQGFYLDKTIPWIWFYRYGTVPGLLLTIGSLGAWFFCFTRTAYRPWHKYFLLIVLTSVIGAGVIVNAVLKNHWGRPRPDQTVQFGGKWEYRDITEPGTPGKGASFPCGHCSMGFLFTALFVFRRKAPVLAWTGLIFGLIYGGLVSITRIIQGAHYPLDTLWSLAVIVLTAMTLYYIVLKIPFGNQAFAPSFSSFQRKSLGAAIILAMILMALAFLTRRPYYSSYHHELNIPSTVSRIAVTLNDDPESVKTEYIKAGKAEMILYAQGFGFPNAKHYVDFSGRIQGTVLYINAVVRPKGYYSELNHRLEIFLPENLKGRIEITVQRPIQKDIVGRNSAGNS